MMPMIMLSKIKIKNKKWRMLAKERMLEKERILGNIQLYNGYNLHELAFDYWRIFSNLPHKLVDFPTLSLQLRNGYFLIQSLLKIVWKDWVGNPLLEYQSVDPLYECKEYKLAHFHVFLL